MLSANLLFMVRVALMCAFLSTVAAAQSDARTEVRAALEDQAPIPSKPLLLPLRALDSTAAQTRRRAAESGRLRAVEATKNARGLALGRLPEAQKDAHGNLGQAGESANGQARAEEVRKNTRSGKPPTKP